MGVGGREEEDPKELSVQRPSLLDPRLGLTIQRPTEETAAVAETLPIPCSDGSGSRAYRAGTLVQKVLGFVDGKISFDLQSLLMEGTPGEGDG